MADLLTHYVSARVAGIRVRDRVVAALLPVGVFLPDLAGKPLVHFPFLDDHAGIPSHTPLGILFVCLALSVFFAAPLRARAFWALYVGSLLHLVLDSMKGYLGSGAIIPWHPFSLESYEMNLYRSEDVYYLLPANLAILAILWALGRRHGRVSPSSGDVTVS